MARRTEHDDEQPPSWAGCPAAERRRYAALEVRHGHSAGYAGPYDSRGRFAADVTDDEES